MSTVIFATAVTIWILLILFSLMSILNQNYGYAVIASGIATLLLYIVRYFL